MADSLQNKHVAVLAMDGVEEAELVEPVRALRDAGVVVDVISADPAAFKRSGITRRRAESASTTPSTR